jgi:hypothetical protein
MLELKQQSSHIAVNRLLQDHHHHQQQQQQQEEEDVSLRSDPTASEDPVAQELAQLIPLLQQQLQAALAALADVSGQDAVSVKQTELFSEGQEVLQALQQQYTKTFKGTSATPESFDSSSSSSSSSVSSRTGTAGTTDSKALAKLLSSCFSSSDDEAEMLNVVEDAMAQCSSDTCLAAMASAQAAVSAVVASAAAAGTAALPFTQAGPEQPLPRLPALHSTAEDDIAAALLSDDFEDACLCLVDAICSCQDNAHLPECQAYASTNSQGSSCTSTKDELVLAAAAEVPRANDSRGSGPPAEITSVPLAGGQEAAAGTLAAVLPPSAASSNVIETLSFPAAAATAAARLSRNTPVDGTHGIHDNNGSSSSSLVVAAPRKLLAGPAARFLPVPAVTTATALAHDLVDDAEARSAAFAGVQEALEKSAALLDALADPSHPLMLAADRDVAAAKTHMGHLLGDGGTVALLG